jgi:hypothetical protein|tara:strand:- start:1857 stop:2030 length:174 start_codon:yes stop_codon:yes gene_type:complete
MKKKSTIEVKLDYIHREIKDLKNESKSLRSDINKGKGAIWLLTMLAFLVTGTFKYFD